MRYHSPLIYLVFRSLPTFADPISPSMISPGKLPVITKTIVDITTHASIFNHASIVSNEVIGPGSSVLLTESGAQASHIGSIDSPFVNTVVKRAHHHSEDLPKDPPYYTMTLWINGYDVTIPILKDNATDFCKSIADDAPSGTSTLISTQTGTGTSVPHSDRPKESRPMPNSEPSSDIPTSGSSAETTSATLTHSENATSTTSAESEKESPSETTTLSTQTSSEDSSDSDASSKNPSSTSKNSHSSTTKDSPSTDSSHEMPTSHKKTMAEDSSKATWSSASTTSSKSILPITTTSSLPYSTVKEETSVTSTSPEASPSSEENTALALVEETLSMEQDAMKERVGVQADATSEGINSKKDIEESSDAADIKRVDETDDVAMSNAQPVSRANPSARAEASVLDSEQVSQAAHNLQPLAWLRAPFVRRRNFDMSLHDSSTSEKVQGWDKADGNGKRGTSDVSLYDHAAGEEERVPILDREASSPIKPGKIGKVQEEVDVPPTFGFDPHPHPLPTSLADKDKTKTDTETDTDMRESSPPPSTLFHSSFETHTSVAPTTTTSSTPSTTPHFGIVDPVPTQKHNTTTAPSNATYSSSEESWALRKWPGNLFVSPLFWGVGAFYIGLAYWEGWQQARGDFVHPDFVDAGVRWVGQKMVRYL